MGKNLLGDQGHIPYVLKRSWAAVGRFWAAVRRWTYRTASCSSLMSTGLRMHLLEELRLAVGFAAAAIPATPAPSGGTDSSQKAEVAACSVGDVRIRLGCPQGVLFFLVGVVQLGKDKVKRNTLSQNVTHVGIFSDASSCEFRQKQKARFSLQVDII